MTARSKTFCIVPWVHTNVEPNGSVKACCLQQGEELGNINNDRFENIWNNEKYRTIRLKLLNGEKISECRRCSVEEENGSTGTMRHGMNWQFRNFQYLVDETREDGSIPSLELLRWDFRFNNLCNLACIGCSPWFSSTWGTLATEMFPGHKEPIFMRTKNSIDDFLATTEKSVHRVKEVYFAGGEPLLHEEHYRVLGMLEKANRFDDVAVSYSTNLTSMTYKSKSIFDYWKPIRNLHVLVSIDEVDETRLHYIRYPSSIAKLTPNLKALKQELNTYSRTFAITPTWSMLNTHRIKEFVEWILENDLLPESYPISNHWDFSLHSIIMLDPQYLSVGAASPEWKEVLHQKINTYEEWYRDTMFPKKSPGILDEVARVFAENMTRFRGAIDRKAEYDRAGFQFWITQLDKVRKTDWKTVFPELAWHVEFSS